MNLFNHALLHYNTYPEILGYFYYQEPADPKINDYDFVFIQSDISMPIADCSAHQLMTSSDSPDTTMWLAHDYIDYTPLPPSEYTEIPTVGFVGRCPIFQRDGKSVLHRGFEARHQVLSALSQSPDICSDFHIRYQPTGDSAGFWNSTVPDFKKNQPLFKTNMLQTSIRYVPEVMQTGHCDYMKLSRMGAYQST